MSFALKLPFLNDHFLFANKHSSSRKFQRLRNLISNSYQGQITVKVLLKKIISKNCQPRQFIKRQLFQILMLGQALQSAQYNIHVNQQMFHETHQSKVIKHLTLQRYVNLKQSIQNLFNLGQFIVKNPQGRVHYLLLKGIINQV